MVTHAEAKAKSLGSKNGFRWVLVGSFKNFEITYNPTVNTNEEAASLKEELNVYVCAPLEFRDTDLNPANE